MNISKLEQRVLHALAQGGAVQCAKDDRRRRVLRVDCFTRDGLRLADCTLAVFAALRRKRLVESREGGPYRISRRGLDAVRAQADNR